MLTSRKKVLSNKRIGFFGKGGCGKSTVAVLLARALKKAGYAVSLIDADSTNVGLAQALGLTESPTPLLDYYGGMVFSGGSVTCPVDDPTPLENAQISTDALPGIYQSDSPEGIHLFIAGKMGDKGPGAGCDGPIAKIARDFKPRFSGEAPVTLVDYKAGFEDSARGNVISLDWIVVVVDPTTAAIQMAINMRDMVDELKAGRRPATAHLEHIELVELVNKLYEDAQVKGVLFILNKIRDEESESIVRERLAEHGISFIGAIHYDPSLSMAWLKGEPVSQNSDLDEVDRIVEALENAEENAWDYA
ncbi:MAG: P-loop NTPase [Candidatus Promineifilaceae bacterium]